MNDMSGPSGQSSSRSHDLQSCLESKLRALLHGSDLCEVIWKPWATPWGQSLSKPRARVRTISEIDSGLWPTARANKRGPPDSHGNVAMWSTIRATDGEKGGPNMTFGAGGQPLPSQAAQALWPTTTTRDYKDGAYNPNVPINSLLGRTVWPTPEAGVFGTTDVDRLLERRKKYAEKYGNNGFGLTTGQAAAISTGSSAPTENRGALNPEFVCWLMGSSPEHLSCAPTETRSTSGRPRRSSKPRSPAAPEEDLFG